jgi:hypothetical protein
VERSSLRPDESIDEHELKLTRVITDIVRATDTLLTRRQLEKDECEEIRAIALATSAMKTIPDLLDIFKSIQESLSSAAFFHLKESSKTCQIASEEAEALNKLPRETLLLITNGSHQNKAALFLAGLGQKHKLPLLIIIAASASVQIENLADWRTALNILQNEDIQTKRTALDALISSVYKLSCSKVNALSTRPSVIRLSNVCFAVATVNDLTNTWKSYKNRLQILLRAIAASY